MITYKTVKAKSSSIKALSQNQVCEDVYSEEDAIPLFQKARSVLGPRLSYHLDTGAWAVDGKPMPIADVVDLANTLQSKRGKNKLLSYPRVSSRYDYGLCGMMMPHR
ncbi:MAG: hypothetical protein ACKO57_08510 [Alphaproteobacteria bacterium]